MGLKMEDAYLTIKELAKYLKVKQSTVYNWINNERIPASKVVGQWRFRHSEIDEWIKNGDRKKKKKIGGQKTKNSGRFSFGDDSQKALREREEDLGSNISQERRKFTRINDVLPIQLRVENPRIDIIPSVSAETIDISEGGLSMFLDLPLPFLSIISLQMNLPQNYSVLSEKAQVLWSTRIAGNKFRSGIRFLEIEEGSLNRLRQVVGETSLLQGQKTDEEAQPPQLEIRQAKFEDIEELLRVEEKVWPKGLRATKGMIQARLEIFPEGFLCAVIGDKIKGFVVTEILNYDIQRDSFSWGEITDYGYIRKTHNPDGDSIYGVSLTALAYNQQKIAAVLLEAVGKFAIKHNYKQIVFGCRIPRYYKYVEDMPEEEYVRAKTKTGRPLDPELAMYQKEGLQVVKLITNYFEDPESLNNGVLLTWENPFFNLENTLRFWSEMVEWKKKKS